MKRTTILIALCIVALGAARAETKIAPGRYKVDLAAFRAEAMRAKPQFRMNGAPVKTSQGDQAQWVELFARMVGSAELNLRRDGTFMLSSPLVDLSGRWKNDAGRIKCTVASTSMKLRGPITFKAAPTFSIFHDGKTLRYGGDEKSGSLPIKRISGSTSK
jgi:hypothetical protein